MKSANSEDLLVYWRNSLVDGYRLQELQYAVEVDKDALRTGKLGTGIVTEMRAKYREASHSIKERGKDAAVSQDKLPVLVCPMSLLKKYNHYQENTAADGKNLVPLWIPALLDKEGKLLPREDHLPWIARDLLEPTTKRGVTIGDIEDVEKFLAARHQGRVWESWGSFWEYAHDMLKAMPEGNLNLPGYIVSDRGHLMPDVEIRGAAMSAIRVIDHLLYTTAVPPLLARYASLDDAPERPVLDEDGHNAVALKHNGQMNGEFPLSLSQREALHHFLQIGHGEILAVNGPPGTGKTTLMHSVAASLWVEAAIKQSQPPVIVVVSANNQAVTNMIDSFSKVAGESGDMISKRWVPEVSSYGLYCPSGTASAREESKKYQVAAPGDNNFPAKNGFPGKVEELEFIGHAEKYYLERVSEYTGKTVASVKEAVVTMHRELIANVEASYTEISKNQEQRKIHAVAERTLKELKENYGLDPEGSIQDTLKNVRARYDSDRAKLQKELSNANEALYKAKTRYIETLNLIQAIRPLRKGLLEKIVSMFTGASKEPKIPESLQQILKTYEAEIAEANKKQNQTADKLVKNEINLKDLDTEVVALQYICAVADPEEKESLQSLQERHDTQNRYRSFLMASHYWEGRWLLEVRNMQDLANRKINLAPEEKVAGKWRRYAMLTPVTVSTLYVVPRLFTAWHREGEYLYSEPLLEFIDLLIVDEAGQAPPELAAATFALAKKAVVVGDVLQIEPVYNITRYVDQGNLIRHGIIEKREEYPVAQTKGIAASGGSVMAVAQRVCPYWPADESGNKYPDRGMFLSEHRRCLDKIISFCNQLAYNGRLVPLRGDEVKPGALAQFSYLQVMGKSFRAGSSRKNEKEAFAILDWLLLNRDFIISKYGAGEKPLKELVAVLTPFTAQKKVFLRTVWSHKKYEPLRGVTFGTIHALQGAERNVVIFSPVYTREDGDPGEFFFNTDIRMLNVAVSRARESFVVMGDMEIFKKSGGPAGLLAKYLFTEKANNLAGDTTA